MTLLKVGVFMKKLTSLEKVASAINPELLYKIQKTYE